MITLRIEHKFSSYEAWKKAFDSDPMNRKKSGVKQYRIFRPADDDTFVFVDLDFENVEEAEKMSAGLKNKWTKLEGNLIFGAKITTLKAVESKAV